MQADKKTTIRDSKRFSALVRLKRNRSHFDLLLVFLAFLISLGIGELFIRLIVDPVDYLAVYLVDDDIVGHKISTGSIGYDSWGFRNKRVPASAKVVAIGDSQTYGTSTTSGNAWPAQLQTLMKEQVYNMSLGGYGPVQYYHLLRTKALKLNPTLVIVGFYFGNDLVDAQNIVYTKDYWKQLRNSGVSVNSEKRRESNDVSGVKPAKLFGSLRNWLAHHSVSYRMFTLAFGGVLRFFEMKYGYAHDSHDVSMLDNPKHKIRPAFTPLTRLSVLNLADPRVEEGFRLTVELMRRMNDLSAKHGIGFVVALIPTKESVFADYIGNNGRIRNADTIDQLIASERQINQSMKKVFDRHHIAYVDLLPTLKSVVPIKTIYPQSEDGHPNAEGNEVIAQAIEHFLMNDNRNKTIGY